MRRAAIPPPLSIGRRESLTEMSSRVLAMRQALYDELNAVGAPGTWDHILQQRGLFTYTGLSGPPHLHTSALMLLNRTSMVCRH